MRQTIPFRIVELEPDSFHMVVKASINGKLVHLIVDTGASRSLIDISSDSGLRVEGVDETLAVGFNTDKISIQLAIFPSIGIGGLTFSDFVAAITDLDALRNLYAKVAGMDIAGLLGCDFLVRYVSSINFRTKRIYLKQLPPEVKSDQE